MSLLDTATSLFAPHDCLSCGREGSLLCSACRTALIAIPERCFRCRKISPASKTCTNCRRLTKLSRVCVATVYDGAAKDLIWHFKFQGAQAAARLMAQQMAPLLSRDSKAILVHIPTATGRIRQRGYDQARLLARYLSKETACPTCPP